MDKPTNTQLIRFGKAVQVIEPNKTVLIPAIVCIYFDRGDEFTTTFVKSDFDLSGYDLIYLNQRYKCKQTQPTNSDLFKTVIVPIDESLPLINIDTIN